MENPAVKMEDKDTIPEIIHIKTEIVKKEPEETEDAFEKCETCKNDSTIEKNCEHCPSNRLSDPGGAPQTNNLLAYIKPKVEPGEGDSLTDDLIDKLIESEAAVKEENYHDVPEILPEGTDFSQCDIKTEDVEINSIKDELDNEVSLSSEALGQDEGSSENPKPGPSEEVTNDKMGRGCRREKIHTEKKSHECQVCLKSFNRKANLVVHFRSHTGEKPYKCETCSNSYASRNSLVAHSRTHTRAKPLICEVCFKPFSCRSALVLHTRIHTGEKPFECQVCYRSFSCSSLLVVHTRVHTGERPFQCKICQKSFASKSSLVRHLPVHDEEKPHKCNVCSKSFIEKSSLVIHTRSHTGETPFKCKFCPRAYARHTSWVRHVRTHTGDLPYQCKFCSKSFSSQDNLSGHEKVHSGTTLEMPSLYKIVSSSKLQPVSYTVTESGRLVPKQPKSNQNLRENLKHIFHTI